MLKLAGYCFSGGMVVIGADLFKKVCRWCKGFFTPPAPPFPKPPKTYAEQVDLLRAKGLTVANQPFAEHCLAHFNYYRLSAYGHTFRDSVPPNQFIPGTQFEQVWNLYCFDRSFRHLINEAAKRVEVSARSRWAYELGHAHGALAYEDASHFHKPKRHRQTLREIDREIGRSHEAFITHFKNVHRLPRPPIWAVCEVMSFGKVSMLYKLIASAAVKKVIAATYSLPQPSFESLLHHLCYIRNTCAHHARLWNRQLTIAVTLPKSGPPALLQSFNPAKPHRIYNTVVLLAHMMNVIEPGNDWMARVRALVDSQPFNVAPHMGFPADWKTRPIWI